MRPSLLVTRFIRQFRGWAEAGDAYANVALDETLFRRHMSGVTLRVWGNQESVIIGRAQLARYETDLSFCEANLIPVVRRFTAGGCVYNGPGNLNWSIFVARDVEGGALRYESDPQRVFRSSANLILEALEDQGVPGARFAPPNGLVIEGGGKVSGMAAYISRDAFVCHGTLLVEADLGRVRLLTTPSPVALERKYTRSRDVQTANAGVDPDSFIRSLGRVLGERTEMRVEESPGWAELGSLEGLLLSRYRNATWNLGDPFDQHLR